MSAPMAMPEVGIAAAAPESPPTDSERALLDEARKRYQRGMDVDKRNRDAQREDTRFVWERGAQWPDNVRLDRGDDRPCLEINQLPQFIKQVVNDQRQIRPAIRIRPDDQQASEECAAVIEGIVRAIEYECNADAAYDSAFEAAVTGGRGYWRIYTDYESSDTFNQVIKIQRIADPLCVLMDHDYVEPDASDINWCFVLDKLHRDEFKRQHPDKTPSSWEDIDSIWMDGEYVILADYFRIVPKKRMLALLIDGSTAWADELPPDAPPGAIVRQRESEDRVVEWHKLGGGELIETIQWAGKYIPVVVCIGDEMVIDGKRCFQGLIRRAIDSQQMYNFWQTAATELIALAPKAPWIAAEGQIEGYETLYQNANRTSVPVLPYKPVGLGGTLAPAPQRTQFAGVPTGIVEQANQCKMDLRATIGIYDPSLGNKSNEISGRAIIAREKQGDTATYHFVDNLRRAISLTGRIIVDLCPKVYDTKRDVRTIAEDGDEQIATINETDPLGGPAKNDVRCGSYAVVVDTGASYATRRMEAADSMMQFLQSFPAASPIIGDLVAKSMDWPGAEQIAQRLKLMLPPQIAQAEAAQDAKQDPALAAMQQQLQQVVQQGHEAVAHLQQELQQARAAAQDTQTKNQAELGRMKVEALQAKDQSALEGRKLDLERENLAIQRDKVALTIMVELLKLMQPPAPAVVPAAVATEETIEGTMAQDAAPQSAPAPMNGSPQLPPELVAALMARAGQMLQPQPQGGFPPQPASPQGGFPPQQPGGFH